MLLARMTEDPRIRKLVEEILDSKRPPAEVCANVPELLPAVLERLEQVQRLGRQLDELFELDEPNGPADSGGAGP